MTNNCDFHVLLLIFLKYEIFKRIWLKANQLVQLNFESSSQLYCFQFSINVFSMLSLGRILISRSQCLQSVHAFTSRYDSTLLARTFLHQRCFYISSTYILVSLKNRNQHSFQCRSYRAHVGRQSGGYSTFNELFKIYNHRCTSVSTTVNTCTSQNLGIRQHKRLPDCSPTWAIHQLTAMSHLLNVLMCFSRKYVTGFEKTWLPHTIINIQKY